MQVLRLAVEPLKNRRCHSQIKDLVFGAVKQLVPLALCGYVGVAATPEIQEQAPVEDLTHKGSEDYQLYIAQIQHRPFGFRPQRRPLLQVIACQPVEDVLLALQELKEMEVRLRSVLDDGLWALGEDVLARLGGVFFFSKRPER